MLKLTDNNIKPVLYSNLEYHSIHAQRLRINVANSLWYGVYYYMRSEVNRVNRIITDRIFDMRDQIKFHIYDKINTRWQD